MKTVKDPRLVFLLCVMTFGIYRAAVVYRLKKEVTGKEGSALLWAMLCLLLPFPMFPIYLVGLCGDIDAEAQRLFGGNAKKCRPISVALSLLFCPDIAVYLVQRQWNACILAQT